MKIFVFAVLGVVMVLGGCGGGDDDDGGKTCVTGKPCGNTCIAANLTCHK